MAIILPRKQLIIFNHPYSPKSSTYSNQSVT